MSDVDLSRLQAALREFAEERDWDQFHNPKNLAAALAVEASELLEIFQWLTPSEADEIMQDPQQAQHVCEEVADVFAYLLRIADILEIDLSSALIAKIQMNSEKYPVAMARGTARKYTEFETES